MSIYIPVPELVLQIGESELMEWNFAPVLVSGDTIDSVEGDIIVDAVPERTLPTLSIGAPSTDSQYLVQARVVVSAASAAGEAKLSAWANTVNGSLKQVEGILIVQDI